MGRGRFLNTGILPESVIYMSYNTESNLDLVYRSFYILARRFGLKALRIIGIHEQNKGFKKNNSEELNNY